jgi:hypothetical protein
MIRIRIGIETLPIQNTNMRARHYEKNTESWLLLPRGKKIWRQDGGMEHNTRKTLPERSLRDYWEFKTK